MVKWFLANKADPNARCGWDKTPMSLAVCTAPLSIIRLLFQSGATPKAGQLLHWAIIRNDSDTLPIVEMLLNFGTPINEIQYENDKPSWTENHLFGMGTPLHTAVEHNQALTISFLLQRGANRNIQNSRGITPLELAEEKKLLDIISILRNS